MKQTQEIARVYHEVAERSSKLLGDFAHRQTANLSAPMRDELGSAKAFMDLYARMAADPSVMASMSVNMWLDYVKLWQSGWVKMFGGQTPPVAETARGGGRRTG